MFGRQRQSDAKWALVRRPSAQLALRWTGSATVSVALLGLLAASLAMGQRLISDIADLRTQMRSAQMRPLNRRGAVLMANGIDQSGRVVDQMPPGTKRMVVFVLTGPTLEADLSFWDAVNRTAPRGTFLLGMCGDQQCASKASRAHAGFPILIYGEVAGQAAAFPVFRDGEFFVTDGRARILSTPPWHRSLPEALAEIEAAR